jgi:hypothetical protein
METNNMNTRARFEEIWPVPEGVEWVSESGMYFPTNWQYEQYGATATTMNARLDTFTRCQETMAPVLSIIEELIESIESNWSESYQLDAVRNARGMLEKHK